MKKLITILSLAVVGFTFAQEEEPTFTVSGSIDAYFRANLTSSNDGEQYVETLVFQCMKMMQVSL